MRLHVYACELTHVYRYPEPVLVRSEASHAGALKAPDEAGRRGGDSIARNARITHSKQKVFLVYYWGQVCNEILTTYSHGY
ncbi:hypothetical protein EYY97_09840 [Hafnia paralvei]|nr:hypothetical protein EYY97_09840 [Hafnia paralvei]